ncbi:MAG: pilus assembly protein [Kineosporiaceae bacterium]|nr:pilus assembly protein [Kineosporiaceae bacterium]
MRAAGRDRGAAALEFAGVAPLVLLAALIALQFGVIGWTVVATGQAARDGARAASLGQNASAAATAALPGSLSASSVTTADTGDGHRCTVQVDIPTLLPLPFELGTVSRTAEMPDIT